MRKQIPSEIWMRFCFDLEQLINEIRYGNVYQNGWV